MFDLGWAFFRVRPGEMEMGKQKGTVLTIDGVPKFQEESSAGQKMPTAGREFTGPFPPNP
jgi:hypothetical protein